ncbi:hypothetical protein AB0M72_06870 [Nocardiopsis dassonvillei]
MFPDAVRRDLLGPSHDSAWAHAVDQALAWLPRERTHAVPRAALLALVQYLHPDHDRDGVLGHIARPDLPVYLEMATAQDLPPAASRALRLVRAADTFAVDPVVGVAADALARTYLGDRLHKGRLPPEHLDGTVWVRAHFTPPGRARVRVETSEGARPPLSSGVCALPRAGMVTSLDRVLLHHGRLPWLDMARTAVRGGDDTLVASVDAAGGGRAVYHAPILMRSHNDPWHAGKLPWLSYLSVSPSRVQARVWAGLLAQWPFHYVRQRLAALRAASTIEDALSPHQGDEIDPRVHDRVLADTPLAPWQDLGPTVQVHEGGRVQITVHPHPCAGEGPHHRP